MVCHVLLTYLYKIEKENLCFFYILRDFWASLEETSSVLVKFNYDRSEGLFLLQRKPIEIKNFKKKLKTLFFLYNFYSKSPEFKKNSSVFWTKILKIASIMIENDPVVFS